MIASALTRFLRPLAVACLFALVPPCTIAVVHLLAIDPEPIATVVSPERGMQIPNRIEIEEPSVPMPLRVVTSAAMAAATAAVPSVGVPYRGGAVSPPES